MSDSFMVTYWGRGALAASAGAKAPRLHRIYFSLLLTVAVIFAIPRLVAQKAAPLPPVEPQVVPLWPDGSPNNPAQGPRPTLEIYRTFAPARPVGATIVIVPGGGYGMLSPYEKIMAEYFRGLGYDAVVVNYRVKPNRYPAAYADALRAIRLVRAHADEWKLPVKRLALIGGSAGGHLAALVATRPDFYRDPQDDLAGKVSARPDRLVLLYPVISAVAPYHHRSFDNWFDAGTPESLRADVSPEKHVTKETPPVILFHALDDTNVVADNSIDFTRACQAAGVPVELHLFPRGGHGRAFAYDAEVSPRWRTLLQEWLANWKE
jgi:acetyl esterase/lipase